MCKAPRIIHHWRVIGIAALIAIRALETAQAATVIGLTVDNRLRRFDSGSPGTIASTVTITGLQPGEHLVAIDFRPLTGRLYGLGDSSRLYLVNDVNGVASAVSSAFSPALSGVEFGFDFNPSVDRIRVVSNTRQNFRLNPDTGTLAATDTQLAYAPGDINSGVAPNLAAVAYSRNYAGTPTTVLYGIDTSLNVLVVLNPPNAGVLNTVGPLGVDPNGIAGFDIWDLNGQALAVMTPVGETASKLFTIDLQSGRAALMGVVGGGTIIQDIAVIPAGCSLEFSAIGYGVVETFGTAEIEVDRRGGSSGSVSISFATSDGTATANSDYLPVFQTLNFADGETRKTVSIPLIADREAELSETVDLTLTVAGETIHDMQRAAVLSIASSIPLSVYALTTSNNLLRFDGAPSIINASVAISGLQPGEKVLGIDFRPANGWLYALGSSSRLYVLNPTNGIASPVSAAPFSPALSGTEFGFDFNPVVDRIRVVGNTGQNLRLNPDTGALAAQDTDLNYAAGDVNSGAVPRLVASAYSQNYSGAATTVLYGLDSGTGSLVIQNPPNAGVLTTVGTLSLNITDEVGFDFTVADGGQALASLNISGAPASSLYRIDLATGATRLIGQFGTTEKIRDLAIAPSPSGLAVRQAGGSAIISWSVAAAGYSLQSANSLSSASWVNVPDVPVLVGNLRVVTNVIDETSRFYRLGH